MKLEKLRFMYLSLREQYLSDRPMSNSEQNKMWHTWHKLNNIGWRWAKIKDEQLRENR